MSKKLAVSSPLPFTTKSFTHPIRNLPRDPCSVIAGFLCYLDVLCWRLSGISHHLRKFNSIDQIVRQRLEERGIDATKFMKALTDQNVYISGSFILQCVLGVDWRDKSKESEETSAKLLAFYELAELCHGVQTTNRVLYESDMKTVDDKLKALNDKDRYVKFPWKELRDYLQRCTPENRKLFLNSLLFCSRRYRWQLDNDCQNHTDIDVYVQYQESKLPVAYAFTNAAGCNRFCIIANPNSAEVDDAFETRTIKQTEDSIRSKKFALQGNVLNVITAKHPLTHISRFFDLSFCKIAYQPGKLMIHNLDDVINKQCVADFSRCERGVEFLLQYMANGECHQESIDNHMDLIYHRLLGRVKKYEHRGFTVQVPAETIKYKLPEKDSVL